MAKKTTAALPPTPESREAVWHTIRGSDKPLTTSQLAKLISAPHKLSAAVLGPMLDEYVAVGTLHLILPANGKGKPQYWDRDPNTLGRAAVLDVMQRAVGPLTAKELSRQLEAPLKIAEVALTEFLNECVAAGRLHAIPPKTPKSGPQYWNRDLVQFGRGLIVALLDKQGSLSKTDLKKGVKALNATAFEQAFQALIAERRVCEHPPIGRTKSVRFGSQPPAPEPYLKDVGVQLTKVVAQLMAANVPCDELRRALVQLIEAAGIPFGSTTAPRGATVPASTVDLTALMRRIEPGAERGALVTAGDLRRAARLDKSEFDRVVLDLARQGRVSLHRHDYVASLSPAERDELVTDGAGTYYVGMALRQREG